MAKTKIHVGLEIGTSKTCMVVGEVKPDATVTIIGVGEVPSEGVVRGEIEDTSKVIQCVYDAWNMAQDHADVDIMTVYLSVTGAHIVGQNNRGTFRLPPDESIISQEHMDEVTEIARDVALGPEQFVLHRVPGHQGHQQKVDQQQHHQGDAVIIDQRFFRGLYFFHMPSSCVSRV